MGWKTYKWLQTKISIPTFFWKSVLFSRNTPEDLSAESTAALLGKKPNTYVFSKELAESLFVAENKKEPLPYVIVRPNLVGSSLRQPIAGWVDNINAFSGPLVSVSKKRPKKIHVLSNDLILCETHLVIKSSNLINVSSLKSKEKK